ncbi:Filamentous hemagglutinin family N-terminal domain-containing protein, CHAT domain-containing [Desulfonema magnum]|uniref:Filamentous hemagglutinin family N-terminal domain-containing protein, CHAT domain-containing n=2 Tax=Desulfonema magnum TaxID=45655 RepID=A0A975BXC4_9BACT|nr:Filamentous hemagglutinin family N-terminal domain-containing protein, CHAT domain-containing [Desulfonema magnum]
MKTVSQYFFVLFMLIVIAVPVHADGTHPRGIKLDGTLGNAGKLSLPGPDYEIKAEFGRQAGANLFHSFQQFNIHTDERATFSGPDSVQNIISRVTGGNVSWIDGRLGSAIPGADLYMLNPAGVMFGANASLDLSGSFHVSTADYLRLGQNERFYANPLESDVLSTAAPSAFGFLDDSVGKITFEGGEIAPRDDENDTGLLGVPEGETVSVIGGDIEIKGIFYRRQAIDDEGNPEFVKAVDENGEPVSDDEGNPVLATDEDGNPIPEMETVNLRDIKAPGGRINMAAVASEGEVIPSEFDLHVTSSEKGDITLSEKAALDVSGTGGGSVFIRGGQFVADNSGIRSETTGDRDGRVIDIQTDALSLGHGARISAETSGTGKGSDIRLKVSEDAVFSGYYDRMNSIKTVTRGQEEGAGDSGSIFIEAKNIDSENTTISTRTSGKGGGGDISLKASESVNLTMNPKNATNDLGCGPFYGVDVLGTYGENSGRAGNLSVDSKVISLRRGTVIASKAKGDGDPGDIRLKGTESVHSDFAWINSVNGGNISVEAKNIEIAKGSVVQAGTDGNADGGNIILNAEETVAFRGHTDELNGSEPSKIRVITQSSQEDAGDSGSLRIQAKSILFEDEASVSAGTKGVGNGGDIMLDADTISFSIYARILSETQGRGNAGDITLNADRVSFTKGAHILSETEGKGNGGNITLNASESVNFSDYYHLSGTYGTSSGIGLRSKSHGKSGTLVIGAKDISFQDGAYISGESYDKGKGGDVILKASETVNFSGHTLVKHICPDARGYGSTGIGMRTEHGGDKGDGDSGSLFIEAKNIRFDETANITSATYGSGKGADVNLKADESVIFSGKSSDDFGSSGISLITRSTDENSGTGGSLYVEAADIIFQEGSFIAANTHGKGKGGDVTLNADASVTFSGDSGQRWDNSEHLINSVENNKQWQTSGNPEWEDNYSYFICGTLSNSYSPDSIIITMYDLILPSGIYAETFYQGEDAGDAGTVQIEADNIYFKDGAFIQSETRGKGNAGNVILRARESLCFTGEASDPGLSSNVYAEVDARSNGGNGGDVLLEAEDILLDDGAKIVTSAFGPGNGGNVAINARETLTLTGADSKGWSSSIASSSNPKETGTPAGHGGNVFIEAGEMFLENGGQIASSSIAPQGKTSGQAGEVSIQVAGTTRLSGVNPHGENEDGFGSGIYARTRGVGDNSGNAGKITLETGSLIIKNGSVIESGTNCDADGGNIEIRAQDSVHISGDASGIQLKERAESQSEYLTGFSTENYNRSVSGVYSESEGADENAGRGGKIDLTAQNLTLSERGKISTSGAGGGKAGNITLNVSHLRLGTDASVSSESLTANVYNFADISERDKMALIPGDLINVADRGDGRSEKYIFTESGLMRIQSVYEASDIEELNGLSDKYAIAEGDVIEVEDTGDGKPGRFAYSSDKWSELGNSNALIVSIADDGQCAGEVICVPSQRLVVLNHITVAGTAELNELSEQGPFITDGFMANVTDTGNGSEARFVFYKNEWINAENALNIADQNTLFHLQAGTVANVANAGDGRPTSFFYSGKEWITLNDTRAVSNMTERDSLSSQTGDVVKVSDMGNGESETFLYAEGAWIKLLKGDAGTVAINADTLRMENGSSVSTSANGYGNAGNITLTAGTLEMGTQSQISSASNAVNLGGDAGEIKVSADNIRLTGNASLTTEAKGAGGGKINVNAANKIYLLNGKITSSVRLGKGEGGDVTTDSKLVILNHSPVEANAQDGDGGAVFIRTDNYIKSSDSKVTATSERGKHGTVRIEAPDIDITSGLTILPADYLDASQWMKAPCSGRSGADVSRFVIRGRDGAAAAPGDLQAGSPVWSDEPDSDDCPPGKK